MEIKHYAKSSLVCWSNSKTHSELLASAALDPDPDNLYHLDLLHLDLQDRSQALQVVGNGYTNIPFRCVAWDVYGEKNSISAMM